MEAMKEVQKLAVAPEQPPSSKDGSAGGYCPVCGRDGGPTLERFGQVFCSEAHVEQYASERRAGSALVQTGHTGVETKDQGNQEAKGMPCGMATGRGLRKIGWCAAAGVGFLIAVPLVASGGAAAAAGTLLSVAAALACPIGMYFMMRGMMKMNSQGRPPDKGEAK